MRLEGLLRWAMEFNRVSIVRLLLARPETRLGASVSCPLDIGIQLVKFARWETTIRVNIDGRTVTRLVLGLKVAGRVVGRDRFPPPRPAGREAWFVISDDEPSSVQSIGRVHGATERRIPV